MNTLAIEEAQQSIKDGEEARARRILAEILLNDPRNEQAWLLLSQVVTVEKAIESLERVLRINPDNQEAKDRLEALIPLFVPPIPTPEISEAEMVNQEASSVLSTDLAGFNEERNEGQAQPAGTSIEIPGEGLDILNSQPSEENFSEKGGEIPTPVEGRQIPQIPSVDEKPVSLEVSDEEIESLLNQQEEKPYGETQTPAQGIAFGAVSEELVSQIEPVSATSETVKPQLEETLYLPEPDEEQSEVAITSLEQSLTETEQQWIAEKQLADKSIKKPVQPKPDKVVLPLGPPKKSKGIRKWVLAIVLFPIVAFILVVGGFAWYYYYGPCGMLRVQDSTQLLLNIQKRWDSSLILATTSNRLVLTEPLVKLDEIRQELIGISVPVCMQGAKENLQNSMRATIEAYISFLQYVSENDIRQKFNIAAKEMGEYVRKMQEVHNCAPFCSTVE